MRAHTNTHMIIVLSQAIKLTPLYIYTKVRSTIPINNRLTSFIAAISTVGQAVAGHVALDAPAVIASINKHGVKLGSIDNHFVLLSVLLSTTRRIVRTLVCLASFIIHISLEYIQSHTWYFL